MLKSKCCLDDATSSQLKSSGSKPGILYGLPKVHKRDIPMRPILSTVGTHNYKLSRWLCSKLVDCCKSDFSVLDSFHFAKEIADVKNDNYCMASFDISSLFTNVPIEETNDIILKNLFPPNQPKFENFTIDLFKRVLENCTKIFFYI